MDFLEKNKEITKLSKFETKAFCKYFFEINSLEDIKKIKKIYDFAYKNNLEILFLWDWTNSFFAFDIFEWIVIKNNLIWWNYDKKTKILKTNSAELISDIAEILEKKFDNNLWHRFIWLPWTIWAAIYWNAWCFWLETQNNFVELNAYNIQTWEIKNFEKKDLDFSYRSSLFKKLWQKYFIIDAIFDLSKKQEKYHSDVDNIDFRKNKQPSWKTCWSFFKNPSREFSAWFLIESVWLKNKNISWAFFSELHANFLMNDWTATYKDIENLIKLAQEKVKEKFDIELVPEVRIIKNKK